MMFLADVVKPLSGYHCQALVTLPLIVLPQAEHHSSILIYILREMFRCNMYTR